MHQLSVHNSYLESHRQLYNKWDTKLYKTPPLKLYTELHSNADSRLDVTLRQALHLSEILTATDGSFGNRSKRSVDPANNGSVERSVGDKPSSFHFRDEL